MVRKRRRRHRSEHPTNVNICWRKAVLGGFTDTKSENQRVEDLQWSLMVRHLFAHWLVPRSSISSLRKSKQTSAVLSPCKNRATQPLKGGAGRHLLDVPHAGPTIQTRICVRNLLQRGKSETSKQGRCIANTAASLRSMTAGMVYCISDHFAKARSCTVRQRN